MTEYKTQLSQIKIDENATKASLDTAKNLINKNTQKLVTDSSLLTNPLLSASD